MADIKITFVTVYWKSQLQKRGTLKFNAVALHAPCFQIRNCVCNYARMKRNLDGWAISGIAYFPLRVPLQTFPFSPSFYLASNSPAFPFSAAAPRRLRPFECRRDRALLSPCEALVRAASSRQKIVFIFAVVWWNTKIAKILLHQSNWKLRIK